MRPFKLCTSEMNPMRLLFKVLVLALLCAGAILGAPSRAASDVPGPKLGLQTWTLRHQTFEQVVNFAVANKIRSVQFTSQHLNPEAQLEETRRKKALLDQYGIVPYAFGVARTSSDPATNRKLFEFARFIGAKLIVVEPAPADWDSLESLVKEYDIRLAIHNHGVGTTYGDPQVVKQILANRDPRIGVCLDVGWITQAGFDVARVFREYQDRVYDIHFKDKKVSVPGDPSAVDTLIGHGSANYPGLFGEIQRSAWSGVMAIETDSEEFATRPQPFVTAAKSFFAHSAPASSAPADREDSITLFRIHPGEVPCHRCPHCLFQVFTAHARRPQQSVRLRAPFKAPCAQARWTECAPDGLAQAGHCPPRGRAHNAT